MTSPAYPTSREALGLPGKRSVEMALAFAEIAKKDLRASGVLYEENLFPQAIFELQQSVEKAVKAIGLLMGLVRPIRDDLKREVVHTSIFSTLIRLPDRLAQLRRNLGLLAAFETSEEGRDLIMKLGLPGGIPDASEMKSKLMDEQTARRELDRLRSLKPRDLWKITLEFNPKKPPNPAILKLLGEAESQWKSLDKFRNVFEKKFASQMSDPEIVRYVVNIYGMAFPEVAPLALVTMWHESETRYPAVDDSDYWDPKMYTSRSGLVRMYPRVARHTKRLCDGALAGSRAAAELF
ncbi:MAG TPA: HEPN domain-containing protein [Nitrososphaerales archaeon]|nr:HEPN domain-containing protein [Nitrososphaerales archaeon]